MNQRSDETEQTINYARNLLSVVAPECEPCDTVLGILTQLDNYIAGLREGARHFPAVSGEGQAETAPKRVIPGCQHPTSRMLQYAQNGACPICLLADAGMAKEEVSRLRHELEAAKAEVTRVTAFNEVMRGPTKRLREILSMPAEGEGTVIDFAVSQITQNRQTISMMNELLNRARTDFAELQTELAEVKADSEEHERTAIAVIASNDEMRAELETANLRAEDYQNTITELCNQAWQYVYPDKTDWEYPAQAIRHCGQKISELESEASRLRAEQERQPGLIFSLFKEIISHTKGSYMSSFPQQAEVAIKDIEETKAENERLDRMLENARNTIRLLHKEKREDAEIAEQKAVERSRLLSSLRAREQEARKLIECLISIAGTDGPWCLDCQSDPEHGHGASCSVTQARTWLAEEVKE